MSTTAAPSSTPTSTNGTDSFIPEVLPGSTCYEDESGKFVCRTSLPTKALWGVGAAALIIFVLLMLLLVWRASKATHGDDYNVNVEAAQVEGPPAIIGTQYNPNSGPAGVYAPRSGSVYPERAQERQQQQAWSSRYGDPQPYHYENQWQSAVGQGGGDDSKDKDRVPESPSGYDYQPQTAPALKGTGGGNNTEQSPYPFPGYASPNNAAPAKSAFVSGRFPRPLYAGSGRDVPVEDYRGR